MTLTQTAVSIWRAGVAAVTAERLIADAVVIDGDQLWIDSNCFPLADFDSAVIVGAGKAAGPMGRAVAQKLSAQMPVSGWINVPGETDQDVGDVHLHGARPIGVNQPTASVIAGTHEILRRIDAADSRTLMIVVLTGGGSALLCRPVDGISLPQYIDRSCQISDSGGDIYALNRLRGEMDDVKAGGLAQRIAAACDPPPTSVVLLISDVMGDAVSTIASGPMALPSQQQAELQFAPPHFVLGNNAVAVDAAGIMAESLGFNHVMHCDLHRDQTAERIGVSLAHMMLDWVRGGDHRQHDAVITGGEPVVHLCDAALRGRGGRNGQLMLAAYQEICRQMTAFPNIALLSAGTDGEDGSSDSAGAMIDRDIDARIRSLGLDVDQALRCNDSHHFFAAAGGLLQTGPTGTNVCDLRVGLIGQN